MEDRIETHEAKEVWMYGISDDSPDRWCPNCDNPIDVGRLREPDATGGLLLCPECAAELPWGSLEDVPGADWFNWACLEKTEYPERACFDEPTQRAIRLDVSASDPRGGDIGMEVTRTCAGDLLIKVENRQSFTYYHHVGTSVEGSYTVIRFRRR